MGALKKRKQERKEKGKGRKMRVELAEVSSKERTKDAAQAGLAEPIFWMLH